MYRRHGHTRNEDGKTVRSPEYVTWGSMKQRCADLSNRTYGARGIKVCARWLDFNNFLADMGPRPPGHTIERKDNDGDYEPNNCRWACAHEQSLNTRATVRVSVNGEMLTAQQIALRCGIGSDLVRSRLRSGWSIERVMSTPERNEWRNRPSPNAHFSVMDWQGGVRVRLKDRYVVLTARAASELIHSINKVLNKL